MKILSYVPLDKEVLIKFWKPSGSGLQIQTPDPDRRTLGVGPTLQVLVFNMNDYQHSTVTVSQGRHKKVTPLTFVDISAMRANFCTKFYITVRK